MKSLPKMTLRDYLRTPETKRPLELAYGVLREPPAPGFAHQVIVAKIHIVLDRHVRRYRLGRVLESPVDVILDRTGALVVQPDVIFISNELSAICTDRIWGAPDLTIEVLSTSRRRHDRVVKVEWYRTYNVRECWIVDPVSREVEVVDLAAPAGASRVFHGRQIVRSRVLPRLRMPADDPFHD
jgi:Uma2 family endonuclease